MAELKPVLVALALLSINVFSATAQNTTTVRESFYFPRDWAWTKKKWTGSDAPYLKISQSIDSSLARKRDINTLTKRYAAVAAKKPFDPQSQFAWGYAAVLSLKPGTQVGRNLPNAISEALAKAPSPNSYQYARMRYLILMVWGTWPQMTGLGKRLLAKNPQDWPVKRRLAGLLALGTPIERQQGLLYANQLVAKYPTRPSSHGTLGDVHMEFFYKEDKIDAGYEAIAAYKRALALNPWNKNDLEYLIHIINKRLARLQG